MVQQQQQKIIKETGAIPEGREQLIAMVKIGSLNV